MPGPSVPEIERNLRRISLLGSARELSGPERVMSLRPAARKLLERFAPSIADSDAMACFDSEMLGYDDKTNPATISAKGIAIEAARHWLAIIEGEIWDLEHGND